MGRLGRRLFAPVALVLSIVAVVWSAWIRPPEPADFTVSNSTEIKSIDPASVTGQPEGFVIRGLFEGLVDWHGEDLHVIPGVAERWTLSEDQKTYTFHLRDNAKWSNGEPILAEDFLYSFRRFLDPMTGAEYIFLLEQVVNAERYNQSEFEAGEPVEVELTTLPDNSLPHARNEVLRGKLVRRQPLKLTSASTDASDDGDDDAAETELFTVDIDGRQRTFCAAYKEAEKLGLLSDDVEPCRQVLLDFSEVAIKAPDQRTITITLKNPTPYFLQLLGYYPLFPVNRVCIETHGYPAWTRPENLVCNGPFVLEKRRVRDRIRFRRNPHFWDQENIHLDTVDILAVESQTTELNMYLRGQIEYFRAVPAPIIPVLLAQDREDFQPVPYLSVYYYKLNTDTEQLKDARVRKALSLAVNRRELVEKVTRAGQVPAYRFVPPGIADFETAKRRLGISEEEPDYEANVREAQRLLADAGYPGGEGLPTMTLMFNSNDMHSQIAEFLQAQWRETLGVSIKLEAKEWSTFLADIRKQDYVIARQGWIGDYVDPNTFLNLFVTDGAQNNTGWGNARYDAMLEETAGVKLTSEEVARFTKEVRDNSSRSGAELEQEIAERLDFERRIKRMEMMVEIESLLLEEQPIIPLYYYVTQGIQRPWIEGWHQNIQDVHPFRGVRINKELKVKMMREGLQ